VSFYYSYQRQTHIAQEWLQVINLLGTHQKRSVASRFASTVDYHVWGAMLEAYHKLNPKSKSITELKEASQVIWDSLLQ